MLLTQEQIIQVKVINLNLVRIKIPQNFHFEGFLASETAYLSSGNKTTLIKFSPFRYFPATSFTLAVVMVPNFFS